MKNILNSISFTRNEAKAIIFIVTVLVTGLSIKYYKYIVNSSSDINFDFTRSDKQFIERSGSSATSPYLTEKGSTDSSSAGSLDTDNLKNFSGFAGEKVNLNAASREELTELPGIGEVTADKIITYRDAKKGFKKIEDLMNVKGIGKKKFEKLKPFLKTN